MPIYEYTCKTCGQSFEKRMTFSEAFVLPPCPDCQSEQTEKRVSRIASLNLGPGGSVTSSTCGGGSFT